MGCGKTVTTAYVADFLRARSSANQTEPTIVCSYSCTDDKGTSSLRNIYCSLLVQLLKRVPKLKRNFQQWYERSQSEGETDPCCDDKVLGKLLYDMLDLLKHPKQSVFLVVDGLDECEILSRGRFLTFLERIHEHQHHVRLFTSYRSDEEIRRRMLETSACIRLEESKARDALIVEYWTSECLDYLKHGFRECVTTELTNKADGSAIWVRLVVQYLPDVHPTKLDAVKHELKGMPTPHGCPTYTQSYLRELSNAKQRTESLLLKSWSS